MALMSTRILLVEDNPADADLIRDRLDNQRDAPPFEIEHVVSLRAALDRLSGGGIDLIFLDLGLPDSYGLPTVTNVINHAPSVPLVVISGFDDPEVKRQALDARAKDFIEKDALDGQRLVDYIRGAHAQQSSPTHQGAGPTAPRVIEQVLIFEPDEGMFVVTTTVLHLLGYGTIRAANPMAIVAQAEKNEADLIVLGLGSGVDEPDLIERLNAVTTTPILALFPSDRVPGVEQWIAKPASAQTLKDAIERIAGPTGATTDKSGNASLRELSHKMLSHLKSLLKHDKSQSEVHGRV